MNTCCTQGKGAYILLFICKSYYTVVYTVKHKDIKHEHCGIKCIDLDGHI